MVVDFETDVIESHNIHLLGVRESDVFKGEMTGNGIVIEENITTDVHNFRLVLHDLLEGIVHSSNSQQVSYNKRHHPELENKGISVEEVLGHFSEGNGSTLGEVVRHVADHDQSSIHADLLHESETGSPDLLFHSSGVHQNISCLELVNFGLFSGEGLDGFDVSETFQGIGGHSGFFFSDKHSEFLHALSVTSHGTDTEDERSEGDSSQSQVNQKHFDHDSDYQSSASQHHRNVDTEDILDNFNIGIDSGQKGSSHVLFLVKEGSITLQDFFKNFISKISSNTVTHDVEKPSS
jgi:hypothetical protein